MIVGNYRTASQRNQQLNAQFEILKLQTDLNQRYKKAQKDVYLNVFEALRPAKNKEQMTLDDIRYDLQKKLSKYMLNNTEVIEFLNSLTSRNMLNDMFDTFKLFEQEYLLGASRLRATRMNELLNMFMNRKLRAEQPINGAGIGTPLKCRGGALPVVKSKYLSAGARRSLMQALKLAGNDAL